MNKVEQALRERFSHVHPLIFARSLEYAKSNGDLFDILQDFPKEYPVTWNYEKHRWKHTKDLLQSKQVEGL